MKNGAMIRALGVATLLLTRQSFRKLGTRFPDFCKTESLYLDFGLEGSRKAGVSLVTFATPQALFLCP